MKFFSSQRTETCCKRRGILYFIMCPSFIKIAYVPFSCFDLKILIYKAKIEIFFRGYTCNNLESTPKIGKKLPLTYLGIVRKLMANQKTFQNSFSQNSSCTLQYGSLLDSHSPKLEPNNHWNKRTDQYFASFVETAEQYFRSVEKECTQTFLRIAKVTMSNQP